ncbi:hypothetical protein LJC55_00650 [Eubacteriales bacterium OttesenSCG-928-N14]|nr:hypothetical protein [Eubacteriales bacterium OttesenSCG-928-N14]
MKLSLGIDTSNYVTSVALVNEQGDVLMDLRTPLPVGKGQLGLRQQEAVFFHIKELPGLIRQAFDEIAYRKDELCAVSYSNAPRNVEGSYMPVFVAGESIAQSVAATAGVKALAFSHQQGHLRAAKIDLDATLYEEYIAVHASGGTTEILSVQGDGIEIIGGTLDISAGQLIDRIGVLMGLDFPAGKQLEELALQALEAIRLPAHVEGGYFNLSGAETAAKRQLADDNHPQLARGVLNCIALSLIDALKNVADEQQILFGGGVMANGIIKQIILSVFHERALFAQPRYAGDNACGTALLAMEAIHAG